MKRLLGLLAWALVHGAAPVQSAEALIQIHETVTAPAPEPFGAHLGFAINHPTHLDASFEGIHFRWRFDVRGGDTHSAVISNGHLYDTIRSGFLDGATAWIYRIETNQVRLVRKSTVIHHEAGDPSISGDPGRLQFADDGPPPITGDHAFVAVRWDNPPRDRVAERLTFSSDVWVQRTSTNQGSLARDPSSTPPNGGRTSLRMTSTSGEMRVESHGQFDGAGQGFYPTLEAGKTYRLRGWMRQTGIPSGQVTAGFTSVYSGTQRTYSVTGDWQEFTTDYVAPPWPGTGVVSVFQVRFQGPGTLWIDNLSFHETSYDAFAPDPRQVEALRDFGIGSMRTFGAFSRSQSLETWTDEPSTTSIGWSLDNGASAMTENKLPSFLRVAEAAGGRPWLVVGGQITEEEWPQLIEYLAAPYDPAVDTPATKPWAAKRHAQGRTAPWTEAFDRIRLEYCNESWNFLFAPYAFDSLTYGRFAEYFFGRAKTSPWWAPAKFDLVLNGWTLSPEPTGFGQAAKSQSPSASAVDTTAYIGGWERGQFVGGTNLTDVGFQDTLLYAAYDQQRFHRRHVRTRTELAVQGIPYQLMVYESGPGYSLPNGGRPFILVEQQYGKSLAAGVCTLDMLLWNSLHGYTAQNYFTFAYGFNWTSHALVANGGHPYPSWSALQMRNRHASGPMVDAQILQSPATDVVRLEDNIDVRHIPLLQPYAFRDGDRYALLLLSRSLTQAITARLDLPFDSATSITRHQLAGDPRTNNLFAYHIRESGPEAIPTPLVPSEDGRSQIEVSVDPGNIQALVFSGTRRSGTPAGPRARLSRAPGQAADSSDPILRYRIGFDRPIAGLEPDDIEVSGTAPFSGREVRIDPVDPELGLPTLFEISVSGMDGPGTVSIQLPAHRVVSVADQVPNLESCADEAAVRYVPRPPSNRLAVWDGFEIEPTAAPNPGRLHQLETGLGWTGGWQVQDFSAADANEGHRLELTHPLVVPGLQSSSNTYAQGGYRYRTAGRALDVRGALADWRIPDTEPPMVGRSGSTLWFSAILRKEANNSEAAQVAFSPSTFAQEHPAWQVAAGFGGGANPRRWSLRLRGDSGSPWTDANTPIPVVPGEPVLLVLRFQFGASDRVSLWVQPTNALASGIPPAPDAYLALTNVDLRFRTLAFYGGDDVRQSSIDDIRFGDSFSAVAPSIQRPPIRLEVIRLPTGSLQLRSSAGAGWTLESAPLLAEPVPWTTANATPVIEADGITWTLEPTETTRFFRIGRP
ncbi:MAG: hypothetical protein IT581_17870 [Verrucomicrobiales bacterium]|nr:hypothetical protein [Verrucomicrobiales bacterium]